MKKNYEYTNTCALTNSFFVQSNNHFPKYSFIAMQNIRDQFPFKFNISHRFNFPGLNFIYQLINRCCRQINTRDKHSDTLQKKIQQFTHLHSGFHEEICALERPSCSSRPCSCPWRWVHTPQTPSRCWLGGESSLWKPEQEIAVSEKCYKVSYLLRKFHPPQPLSNFENLQSYIDRRNQEISENSNDGLGRSGPKYRRKLGCPKCKTWRPKMYEI